MRYNELIIFLTNGTLFSDSVARTLCLASFKSTSIYADVIGLTMTLLVSNSRTIITLGCDQNEILILTDFVCENGKNPLQSESIFSSVADFWQVLLEFRKWLGK